MRRKLYMGALVAVRPDTGMRAFYHRLLSRGKRKKQAWWPWPTSSALGLLPQMNRRRMMGRLRESYAGQLAQGVA